jgi:hypothetical protein
MPRIGVDIIIPCNLVISGGTLPLPYQLTSDMIVGEDVISRIRLYWSDGRGADLQHYAALAYGIAVFEYAISPEHLVMWALWYHGYPNQFSLNPLVGPLWWPSIIALTVIWIVVVVMGFRKCGWPSLILLISIPWGLRLFMSADLFAAACLFLKDGCV